MLSYWDFTEKERAAFTSERVEEFVDVELMRAGVVRVRDLVLVEEPPMQEPDVTIYQLQHSHWTNRDICFATPEEALASARGQLGQVESEFIGGGSYGGPTVQVLKPIEPEQLVAKEVKLFSPGRVAMCREQLEKALAARKKNEELKKEHKEALEKQRKALEGMWNDWHACRTKADDNARVLATREEYRRLADGNAKAADAFLRKTFGDSRVDDALEWAGEAPARDRPPAAAPPVVDEVPL